MTVLCCVVRVCAVLSGYESSGRAMGVACRACSILVRPPQHGAEGADQAVVCCDDF